MLIIEKDDRIEIMESFSDWLQNQLDQRQWTALDLAERAGLGRSTVTRILTGVRGAGPDVCTKIAEALGEDPQKVFRLAGLLPKKDIAPEKNGSVNKRELKNGLSSDEEELLEWYRQLPTSRKEAILDIIKGLVARAMKRQQRHS